MNRHLIICVLSSCMLIGSYLFRDHLQSVLVNTKEAHRQVLIERQSSDLRSRRLSDGSSNPILLVIGESVSSMQVRVAEFLAHHASHSGNVLRYEQKLLPHPISEEGLSSVLLPVGGSIQINRLSLELQVPHALALLEWLERVALSAGGWPVETRSCDTRRAQPDAGLIANCVLDIYYWPLQTDV